jgi:hypothetical protein
MPVLIFLNGAQKEVKYSQAAEVLAILDGRKEPKDDKQAAFMEQVADVIFESKSHPVKFKPSPEKNLDIHAILGNTKLSGKDKAAAIADSLRSRT